MNYQVSQFTHIPFSPPSVLFPIFLLFSFFPLQARDKCACTDVIAFKPIPFLFGLWASGGGGGSLMLFHWEVWGETQGLKPVQPLSSLLPPRGGREAGGGGEEAGVCVDLPLPSFRETQLLVDPFTIKQKCWIWGGEYAPFIYCWN